MVFLLLTFLLLVLVLLLPIIIVVDTISGEYYIQLKGIAKASFEPHRERVLRIHLKLFVFNSYFYPLEYKSTRVKKKGAKFRRKKIGDDFRKIIRLLKSFKLSKLYLNVDTGNNCLNAKMYPILFFLNQYRDGFAINFHGKNELVLHLYNRPIHLLKSYINF